MGLLSDPSLSPRNKIGRSLAKHSNKICLLFYIAGLVWFICLSHSDFNHSTYLSENALSPGLVYAEVKQDSGRFAQTLLEELNREREKHKSTMPYAWVVSKMKQIGLETHVHNFTLRYPFTGPKEYHGKNVYGILRAPRIGSTEGVVFSAPYRDPTSVHEDITASVPTLLAFADFARKKNYWAKDLIFLVTEQEQLGMQAWLDAYFEGGTTESTVLQSGNLPARAGALQAALNLEIQSFDIDYIDVKVEGLNGQLPNLDMFNLVQRITAREGISAGYKQTLRKKRRSSHLSMEENLKHMTSMLMSQITGVPNGNHGLFHRHRIESLTLEAVKRMGNSNANNRHTAVLELLKTVEGISRSLNNLLERFHQSYFFYILVHNDRFVSIGDFIPCIILLASAMFIKAFLLWLTLDKENNDPIIPDNENENENEDEDEGEDEDDNIAPYDHIDNYNEENTGVKLPYSSVFLYVFVAFGFGAICCLTPFSQDVRYYIAVFNLPIVTVVNSLLWLITLSAATLPFVYRFPEGGLELLHIATLIFLGTALIVVGLLNFALGFLIAILSVPLAILIKPDNTNAFHKTITLLYSIILNPVIVIYLAIFATTFYQFSDLPLRELSVRAIKAAMDWITFMLMDSIIYGNWLYTIITAVFTPLWTLCWSVSLMKPIQSGHLKEE